MRSDQLTTLIAETCGIGPRNAGSTPTRRSFSRSGSESRKTLIDLDIRDEYGVCLPLIKSDDAEQFMNIALCGALGPTFDDMSSGEQRVCIDMVTAMMNERPITYSQSRIWKHISNSQQAFDFINSFYEVRGRKLYAIHLNVQQRESISIIKTREVIPGLQFTNGRLELWAKSLDEDVASNYILR